jgi:hypothetical protein
MLRSAITRCLSKTCLGQTTTCYLFCRSFNVEEKSSETSPTVEFEDQSFTTTASFGHANNLVTLNYTTEELGGPGYVMVNPISLTPAQHFAYSPFQYEQPQISDVFSINGREMKVPPMVAAPATKKAAAPAKRKAAAPATKPADASLTKPGDAFQKPAYTYTCLIGLALKNSQTGALSVAEIYNFLR